MITENPMRKIVSSITVFVLLVCGFMTVGVYAEDIEGFYIAEAAEYGVESNIKIEMKKTGNQYVGNIYLPGKADVDNIKLSWNKNVQMSNGGVSYNSGEAPIPEKGKSITYTAEGTKYTFTSYVGSAGVKSLFLNIDETYGDGTHTITAMNTDEKHNAICYGTIAYDSKNYDMTIKGRGNWTWRAGDKKPYNITIYKDEDPEKGIEKYSKKKNVKLINGVEAKKWSLLANYSDGSMMRNRIGYELAQKIGIGLSSQYVDIWMNGKYIGNYLMTPKSDYKAPEKGYMLELDNNLDEEDPQFALEGLNAAGSAENIITVKSLGDEAVEAGVKTDDIKDWMQNMLNAVMDTTSEDYKQYIDVDSWAKLYLIQEYCKNYDVICGSILMHRDGLTPEDKLVAGPVWDLDNAWGHVFDNKSLGMSFNEQFSAEHWYIDSINGQTAFLQYLGMHEDFMERVYEIYNENYDSFAEVPDKIDSLTTELSNSASMNYCVWNVNQYQYNTVRYSYSQTLGTGEYGFIQEATTSWDKYISNLKAYVNARLKYMSDKLIATEPIGEILLEEDDKPYLEIQVTNGTQNLEYKWQVSDDGIDWEDVSCGTKAKIEIDESSNGKKYRCIVTRIGENIETRRVAKAKIPDVETTITYNKEINICNHEYEATTTVEANCQHEGVITRTCKKCRDVKEETIKKQEHERKHIKINGGYLYNGSEYDECIKCHTRVNVKTIPGYSYNYVKSFKVIKGKKSFTAKWKKQSKAKQKKFSGYRIRYSLKSNMANAKTVYVSKNKSSKTITNLSKKKKYYVEISSYVKKGEKKYYSKKTNKNMKSVVIK